MSYLQHDTTTTTYYYYIHGDIQNNDTFMLHTLCTIRLRFIVLTFETEASMQRVRAYTHFQHTTTTYTVLIQTEKVWLSYYYFLFGI